jgi:hypothetical protein
MFKTKRKIIIFVLVPLIFLGVGMLIGGKLNSFSNSHKWRSLVFSTPIFDDYFRNVEIGTTFKSSVPSVECPNDYLGIVGFGQSNVSNLVVRSELVKSIPNVFMWDWTNGKCYSYSEPLVGTDGGNSGNLLSDTVLNLRERGFTQNILIAPMARDGSSVFFWYKGRQKYRLDEFLHKSKQLKLEFDYWIWIQGETDAIPELYLPHKNIAFGNNRGEINSFYERALNAVFDKITLVFPSAIFGVSITSKCNNSGNYYVRLAQNNIIEERLDAYLTMDTDTLGDDYRSDGCHFNQSGAKIIGNAISEFVLLNESQ